MVTFFGGLRSLIINDVKKMDSNTSYIYGIQHSGFDIAIYYMYLLQVLHMCMLCCGTSVDVCVGRIGNKNTLYITSRLTSGGGLSFFFLFRLAIDDLRGFNIR